MSGEDGVGRVLQGNEVKLKEYIEKVAQSAEGTQIITIGQAGREAQTLIPFINAFEGALEENKKLQETLEGRVELLSASIDEDAGELHGRIGMMGGAFAGLFKKFKDLEMVFERSAAVAARSGKMIENMYRLKRQSQDAKELFQVLLDLTSGKGTAKLDSLLDSPTPETRAHGAELMRRLRVLGEAKIAGAEGATRIITELTAKYEERLLKEFHAAFEENQMDQMKIAAMLLVKYNGGQSCVQSFVAQHAFFVEPVRPETIRTRFHPSRSPCVEDLSQPPQPDSVLVGLYEQIAQTAEADWTYLEAVFEDPVSVMNYLMQRIFHEPVQVHLDEILRQAREHSQLSYLRTLYASYKATTTLVEKIKSSYGRHVKEVAARSESSFTSSQDVGEVLTTIDIQLQGLMNDLFSGHLQPTAYIELEQRVSIELYAKATAPITAYLQAKRMAARGVMSSVFGRSSAAITATSSPAPPAFALSPGLERGGGTTTTMVPFERQFVFAGGQSLQGLMGEEGVESKSTNINNGISEGIPSKVVAKNCLSLHAELAARLFSLLPDNEKSGALEQSLRNLMAFMLDRYVEPTLDWAIENGGDYSGGFESRSFILVQAACDIISLLMLYCQSHFLPLVVSASSLAYRRMVQAKTEAAARITGKIDRLLRKELDNSLRHVEENLLSRQRRNDYRPKPDDLEALVGPSQTCEATCHFVTQLTQIVIERLDSANATCFLAEFGSGLHALLLTHLKNHSVSDSGAMVLQNDLKRYRGLVELMAPASALLKERFEMLWEVGHLFVVRPENLRSVLAEGHLGRLDAKLIYPYIAQRADFSTAKIDQLFPDMEKSFSSRLFL